MKWVNFASIAFFRLFYTFFRWLLWRPPRFFVKRSCGNHFGRIASSLCHSPLSYLASLYAWILRHLGRATVTLPKKPPFHPGSSSSESRMSREITILNDHLPGHCKNWSLLLGRPILRKTGKLPQIRHLSPMYASFAPPTTLGSSCGRTIFQLGDEQLREP